MPNRSNNKPLRLYISPCPNDTFVFYGLIHGLVDCEGLTFNVGFEDIDCLNQRVVSGFGDVVKISCAALPLSKDKYKLLKTGAALGYGNGPLVVSRRMIYADELGDAVVGIPGLNTTANLLLSKTLPKPKELKVYLFSDIAEAVMDDEVDAGVLIHEGRFTYKDRGLKLVADLGDLWEQKTGSAIPLGCIVASAGLDEVVIAKVERIIRRSVEYAMKNPLEPMNFVRCHARELDEKVVRKHIECFVNDFTIDLGPEGLRAINLLVI